MATATPSQSPTAAGSYHVTATITNPNYSGSAIGTLVITPAQISVNGITASNKVYDGSTTATIDTANARWWAWSRATR